MWPQRRLRGPGHGHGGLARRDEDDSSPRQGDTRRGRLDVAATNAEMALDQSLGVGCGESVVEYRLGGAP
jgi:hypothetical protein